MNSDVTHAPWGQLKIQLRKTWSELTDEDLETISRDRDELVHVVSHRYSSEQDTATTPPRIVERNSLVNRGRSASIRIRVGN